MTLVLTILQLLSALAVTVIVLSQSGKRSGLSGAIAGGADTFLSKNKAKSWDAKLARWKREKGKRSYGEDALGAFFILQGRLSGLWA